jgi:hypothetical protein
MWKSLLIVQIFLASAGAQQGPSPVTSTEGITGVVRKVSLDDTGQGATLAIESGSARIPHQIHCTSATRITKSGKPVPLTQVKKGWSIECTGTLTGDAMEASSCTVN